MKLIKIENNQFPKIDNNNYFEGKDNLNYIRISKESTLYKLTPFSCDQMNKYWESKNKCERGNHTWLGININIIIDYWDKINFNIILFKIKKNISLIPIYKKSNYKILKKHILEYPNDIKIESNFLNLENKKSKHKYWNYTNNEKLWFLTKFAFGLEMSVNDQIDFIKDILKIDRNFIDNTQVGFQTGTKMYDVFKNFVKIYNKMNNKDKIKKNQRCSVTEIDIIILYTLCEVYKQYNGWYIHDKETIYYPNESIEEIVLLNPYKYLKCFKQLNMEYV